jgi:hypothetical protein
METGLAALSASDILSVVAILVSVATCIQAQWEFRKTTEFQKYAELDGTYREILAMAVEKPHLRKPEECTGGSNLREYDAYAYIVWNFLETVFDRSDRKGRGDGTKEVVMDPTWKPVFDHESKLHAEWFASGRSEGKFKKPFQDFAIGNLKERGLAR